MSLPRIRKSIQIQYRYVNQEMIRSVQLACNAYLVSMIWLLLETDTTGLANPVLKVLDISISLREDLLVFKDRSFRESVQAIGRQNGIIHCERALQHNV